MTSGQITFDDGLGYERYMGRWSRLAGGEFLAWLSPPAGLRWLDVGCGNGAFTETIVERCAPAFVDGVDPSEAQLAFARTRLAGRPAAFHQGDGMALPFADDAADAAVMPLVIFFLPEPWRGVAEMARVVRPGGIAAAYAWDLDGGGFPYYAVQEEMRAAGLPVRMPPSPEASRFEVMRDLWTTAGFTDVDTCALTVARTFAGFDDYWATVLAAPSVGAELRALPPAGASALQASLRARLPMAADGRMTLQARAHAITGRVPR